jgi:hypothetical protein
MTFSLLTTHYSILTTHYSMGLKLCPVPYVPDIIN